MNMNLVVYPELQRESLLFKVLNDQLMSDILFRNLGENLIIAVDKNSSIKSRYGQTVHYNGSLKLMLKDHEYFKDQWCMISNGRYVLKDDTDEIFNFLKNCSADAVLLDIQDCKGSYFESYKLASTSVVAGIKRSYEGQLVPEQPDGRWPEICFIKMDVLNKLLKKGVKFDLASLRSEISLDKIRMFKKNERKFDLQFEGDILEYFLTSIQNEKKDIVQYHWENNKSVDQGNNVHIYGDVYFGENVKIHDNATIIGPCIIGDRTEIRQNSLVDNSILLSDTIVNENSIVRNSLLNSCEKVEYIKSETENRKIEENFKKWPAFSYPCLFKRWIDILVASVLLILFAPAFPIIAVLIKANSPGPVFFRHKRQGLHGKPFKCIKFRTMITGADDLQDKLRIKNEVDGPQFKMDYDPRITVFGKFLRETFLDEIPQFINVLKGEMSLVGPRPSPKKENTLCPQWRYARLSVRPGITGLWQVSRTRRDGCDFQEWIYYDCKYVRELSFKTDMLICFKTLRKMVSEFINQFK